MGAINTEFQSNKPWTLTWKASGRYPMVADRIYATLADAQAYIDDLTPTASATPGLVLSVVNDGKNNGIYYVQSIAQAATETTEFIPGVLVAAGAGAGSEAVDTYAAAMALATIDNLGQILYVKKTTYKKGDGYTEVESEADKDADGKIVAEYTAGPYIVTGANSVAKLGTTSATGNIAGDVESLKGRVGTAESEIDALQTAVGDSSNGLVKNVTDLQTLTQNQDSRITANENAVTDLRSAVAGGVHFRGVYPTLPEWKYNEDGEFIWDDNGGIHTIYGDISKEEIFYKGDIIIVSSDADVEPTKEYIFTITSLDEPAWVELGDVSASDQKIADLEKEFDDHVKAMDEQWTEHVNAYAADKSTFALKTELQSHINDTYTPAINTINQAIDARKVKNVDTTGNILSLDANGNVKINLTGYVEKDGNKVLSTNDYTNAEKTKLGNIAEGAQVNVIEEVKVNGSALIPDSSKSVNIDVVSTLSDSLQINGLIPTETDVQGGGKVATVTLDAGDINITTAIGTHNTSTSVQTVLSDVYTVASSKIGRVYLNNDTTTKNVLALSKTAYDNDTIQLKIANNSAIKATDSGLDIVWTEL